MTRSRVLHLQREQEDGPFWRVAYVAVLVLLVLIGAALVAGPILLMLEFRSPWLSVLVLAVAFGAWILVQTVTLARTLLWRSRHRSSFVLHESGIGTTEWRAVGAGSPVRRAIPWADVSSVVASYRILRRTVARGTGRTLTETSPVLHVLFDQDGRRQLCTVPFSSHDDPAVDVWIDELRDRGVALDYTARLLSWKDEDYLADEQLLEYFADTDELVAFPESGGWQENAPELEHRWGSRARAEQVLAERRDPALRTAWLRPTGRHLITGGWLGGLYAYGGTYFLLLKTQDGTVPPTGWLLGLTVVLPAAALFFLPLRWGLRWYHGAICWLLLMTVTFACGVASVEMGPAAEQMALSLFGLSVASATFLWIPWVVVRRRAPAPRQPVTSGPA